MSKLYKHNGVYCIDAVALKQTDEMFLNCGDALEVDIKLIDRRHITDKQRRFIFALCGEIARYTGYDSEWVRMELQQQYASVMEIEVESLSSCSMTYANGLIRAIIDYCIYNEIPFAKKIIADYDYTFDEKQSYALALKRRCVICGKHAEIHHVDAIGAGNNRQKISHVGKRALPLCRGCHIKCHTIGNEIFIQENHLSPFIIDKKMEYFIKKGELKVFDDD